MWLPDRIEAESLLRNHVKQENLVRHMIATEAIMRALARKLGEDEELWGMTGLLHDMDLELVSNDLGRHARETVRILSEKGYPDAGLKAILTHNAETGEECTEPFHFALSAAETITGLIVACTLVYPSKRVGDVKPKSIRKRMKERRFAANVDRGRIRLIEETGIPLDEFINLSLDAMKGVGHEIGL